MKTIVFCLLLLGVENSNAQTREPVASVERVVVDYRGKTVMARRLVVSSEIPIALDDAWRQVKTPGLLQFVAKGMIRFKPTGDGFPAQWETGQTYGTKMRVFGFIPFGGTHYLFIEKIDDDNHQISTREWDRGAKIWNHDIVMKDTGNGKIHYEDSIVIHGGMATGFITSFAKRFYKHRQKRWQIVAKENLEFGQ